MADGTLFASAEADVQRALMAMLRSDAGVKAIFGDPARVYDDETRGPDFPYTTLERHEAKPSDAQVFPGTEHIFSFAVISRYGGRAMARDAVGALRAAIESTNLTLQGQRVVLAYASYADVLRTRDLKSFRGLLRIRMITEEAA